MKSGENGGALLQGNSQSPEEVENNYADNLPDQTLGLAVP
jgi:hypothetical protein